MSTKKSFITVEPGQARRDEVNSSREAADKTLGGSLFRPSAVIGKNKKDLE